jgi:5-methyltetrahydropteroyltriglutamate--homocysteine methyltransferase
MSMERSTSHIRTTHTGSLPRPPDMLETLRAIAAGQAVDMAAYEAAALANHVADIVKKQVEAGIDTVTDGECSKPSFQQYVAERLAGFEPRMPAGGLGVPTGPIGLDGRDAQMFPDFYRNVLENNPFRNTIRMAPRVCVGPIRYIGHEKLQRDIRNLKAAMAAAGADEGFMPASAPITAMENEYYKSEEEFITAYGDAMREEYQAILDGSLLLQIDFPMLVSRWDTASRTMSIAEYRKWAEERIAYLNHALRGLPEDRIRFHTCYGVSFGPRVSDLQLENLIDLIFTIKASAYSFVGQFDLLQHAPLMLVPRVRRLGKILIPGAVTHSKRPQALRGDAGALAQRPQLCPRDATRLADDKRRDERAVRDIDSGRCDSRGVWTVCRLG